MRGCSVFLLAGLAVAGVASAQDGLVVTSFEEPTLDRWNYPYNGTPGLGARSSVFGALGLFGFDDRDGQFLLGFDTSSVVPTGAESYRVARLRVTASVNGEFEFLYDPTPDPLESYYDPEDPEYVADPDPGRPIELFATGYRNGYTALTYTETAPYGVQAEQSRNAFVAVLDAAGEASDASNHVEMRFQAPSLAVGTVEGLSPGDVVPADATFVFDVALCGTGLQAYMAQNMGQGMVHLTLSSLHNAQLGLPIPVAYPVFYTRENGVAQALGLVPTMELTVVVDDEPDLDGSGSLDLFDILTFLNYFNANDRIADYDGNCSLNLFDILAFLNAFNS